MKEIVYAGFWLRLLTSIIDTLALSLIIVPIITLVYGASFWSDPLSLSNQPSGSLGFILNYVLPALFFVLFWIYKSATPGKIILNLSIVDAKTLGKPSTGQFVIRYIGYYISTILLFLGFVLIGVDAKKQGLHDKMAGTLVIKNDNLPAQAE